VVHVPLVVCGGFQDGARIGLLFLDKNCIHSYNFYSLDSVNKFLNFCVLTLLALKMATKILTRISSCWNCFQTLDRMIFGTLIFPGTRWYLLTAREPQMVHDQKKFGNHWLNANKKLLTACQPWNHDNHHPCMGLSCYRCHGQLSRTCVPNLSFDYFNQSCSAKVKITLAVILPHRAILPHEAK